MPMTHTDASVPIARRNNAHSCGGQIGILLEAPDTCLFVHDTLISVRLARLELLLPGLGATAACALGSHDTVAPGHALDHARAALALQLICSPACSEPASTPQRPLLPKRHRERPRWNTQPGIAAAMFRNNTCDMGVLPYAPCTCEIHGPTSTDSRPVLCAVNVWLSRRPIVCTPLCVFERFVLKVVLGVGVRSCWSCYSCHVSLTRV